MEGWMCFVAGLVWYCFGRAYSGLARTVYIRIYTPYIWWFPSQKYRMYTVHIWSWPTLGIFRALFWLKRVAQGRILVNYVGMMTICAAIYVRNIMCAFNTCYCETSAIRITLEVYSSEDCYASRLAYRMTGLKAHVVHLYPRWVLSRGNGTLICISRQPLSLFAPFLLQWSLFILGRLRWNLHSRAELETCQLRGPYPGSMQKPYHFWP